MFQYSVTNLANQETAIAALDTEDPNEITPLMLSGDAMIDLEFALDRTYGAFGHLFDVEETTAIDLDYALSTLNGWQVESTGDSRVTSYDPGIPANAVT